jgi:cyclopropane-fatty-acyl-phospholipid synthase
MQRVLDRIGRGFEQGRIEFATKDGRTWTVGRGEPCVRVHLRDAGVLRRIAMHTALRFGETYVDGGWVPEHCTLGEVLDVGIRLQQHFEQQARWPWLQRLSARWSERNGAQRSRRNVAHHYDLGNALYRLFLDADLHYSCAYFADPGMSLEQAQQAKCALIAHKLDLRADAEVLDIGCGWGSLAMYLAEHHGARVTGITLSSEQLALARQRVRERGLQDRVSLRLEDYRDTRGRFDAVVSVGMFEHVGRPQYRCYFDTIARLLKPDGTALVHSIGRSSPPGCCNPWIQKYIFPGGYVPAASEMLSAVETSGLVLSDLEIWRRHYAMTLAEWQRRFEAAHASLPAGLDERFRRLWSFYLLASEACFRVGGLVVFHAQLIRHNDRLPLTRDYLYEIPQVPGTGR